MKKRLLPVFVLPLFLFLNSCIGLSMDIQMRANGSGKIAMEYRISEMAETIGRLDGNERWQIIPVGRADWERTIERIDGMKIVSFSSRTRSQEVITNITLEYENTQALLKFLDPAGNRATLSSGNLGIIINENIPSEINTDLIELMKQVSSGYKFAISFSADKNSTMTITDGAGREISPPPSAQIVSSGRKVSFSIDTAEIFELKNGLGVRFGW
jgi:hypothetical protein